MKPTRSEFEEFFRLHAQKADSEKKLKPLGDKIKAYLLEGGESPADLPNKAIIRTQNRKASDWKGAFSRFLFGLWRSQKKVDAKLDEVEAAFEIQPAQTLCVEINHEFIAKGL